MATAAVLRKVCPIVFRDSNHAIEILAFEHPLAGYQLVKGTIESGESIEDAALRELAEESGIEAIVRRSLGVFTPRGADATWAFVECTPTAAPPSGWIHHAPDDGGHSFRFFWHPLFAELGDRWHPMFRSALEFIRQLASDTAI